MSSDALTAFDASCFDGRYVTGDIDMAYLDALESERVTAKAAADLEKKDKKDDDELE